MCWAVLGLSGVLGFSRMSGVLGFPRDVWCVGLS